MRTSGIKCGDVNECRRSHTNWDVLNIDLVTSQRLHRPGKSDWSECMLNCDDGHGDKHVLDSDPSVVRFIPAARWALFLSVNSVKGIKHC